MSLVKHLILPGYEHARLPIVEGETISDFLERSEWEFKLPTICVVNGEPVLRDSWHTTTISAPDNVVFFSKPYGGGGGGGNKLRTVLAVVALVAIAVFAPYLAGTVLGLTGLAYSATVAAVTMAGGLLVSSFLQPKAASNETEQVSQIYSLSAAGNTAAPFQVIPVQYGRLKVVPEYASIPWTEFIGNDAYLNVLLALGQGKYHLEEILIDDTGIWDETSGYNPDFTDISFQKCDPNEPFTLFPSNVISASEVNGQEVTDVPLGYYVINNAGTTLTDFAIDLVFPGGMRTTNDEGKHFAWGIYVYGDIQRIDDTGTPLGAPLPFMNAQHIVMNTPQPQRVTFKFNLAALGLANGRYQARLYRYPTTSTDTDHVVDVVQWAGLRGFLLGSNTFPNCSVLGIRIKASAQLSQNSAKRFGVVTTRILPVWNGTDLVEQPTRNAWWAFYDAARNPAYGLSWPVSKIDFQTIVDQAAAADTRGDTFNYRFTSAVTFQNALDTILMSNRAKVTWLGDVLSATRDEWQAIPNMLISDQQIVRGTLEVDFILNSEDSSDCVQGQFLNENTWQPAMLQYPPNSESFTAQRPASMQIDGITDPDHMFEELRFFWKQSQRRRIKIRLDTEHDGRLLRYGSRVKVQSFLPRKWGASGEVLSYNPSTKVLTINRSDLDTAEAGQHYIELRSKTGGYFGPVKCSFSVASNKLLLDSTDLAAVEADFSMTVEEALERMDGAEPPSFVWGVAGNLSRDCIVLSGRPNGDKVSLDLTADYEDVHDNTGSTAPELPSPPPYADPRSPTVTGLAASFKQGVSEPVLAATWWPSKGAIYYKAQISYDGGNSWTTVADALSEPQLTITTAYSDLRLRVAAVGYLQGPWSAIDVEIGTLQNILPVGPEDLSEGLQDYIMNRLRQSGEQLSKVLQQIASIAAETDAAQTRNTQVLRAVAGNAFAQVKQVSSVFADFQTAYAAYQVEVSANFDGLTSSVTTNASAISTVEGVVNAAFTLTLDVNGNVSGFESVNDGTTSVFRILATHFVVADPGVSGGTPVNVFDIGTIGGVASIGISGNMYLDGTLTARMIAAGTITGNKIAANTLTATNIVAGSINATSLAVNSVGIDQIIAGAVSNTVMFSTPAMTDNFSFFFSQSVQIRSGKATVYYSGAWNSAAFAYGGSRPQGELQLWVDGALVKSWLWNSTVYPFAANQYELYTPVNVSWTVNLSDGFHTFQMKVNNSGLRFGWEAGQVFITDFRR